MQYYVISTKKRVALHFKIATYCEIQKISNFGDSSSFNHSPRGELGCNFGDYSLRNFRDEG